MCAVHREMEKESAKAKRKADTLLLRWL